jgi:hypothetical protein
MTEEPIEKDLKSQGIPGLVLKVIQHCQLGQLEEAEEISRMILECHPHHPQISHLLTRLQELKRRNKMAASWVEKALCLDVNSSVCEPKPIGPAVDQEKQTEQVPPLWVSVIVCSAQDPTWKIHEKHVARTIGCPHEYVRIDNTKSNCGICEAYNLGVERATGNIFVFVHEDVFFVTPNWGRILQEKFTMDKSVGLVGVAGTSYLYSDNPRWNAAGRPFVFGRVIHSLKEENKCYLTVFSEEEGDVEVVGVDGLFFAVHSSLFNKVRFDSHAFDQFHFYDLDLCMQVRETHRLLVTHDILVKHCSLGSCEGEWEKYGKRFLEKHSDKLPVSTGDKTPDSQNTASFASFDLRKILASKTFNHINCIAKDP